MKLYFATSNFSLEFRCLLVSEKEKKKCFRRKFFIYLLPREKAKLMVLIKHTDLREVLLFSGERLTELG